MTGPQFETDFCEILQALGYWALNIPKNRAGAQPFDVIAMHGNNVMAIDCKVCQATSFPLDRVEENQWTAFEVISARTDAHDVGIMVLHKGDIYFFPYRQLKDAQAQGARSLPLSKRKSRNLWNMWMSQDEIKELIGRVLE